MQLGRKATGAHIGLNAHLLSLAPNYRSAGINRYIHNLLLGLARVECPHRFTVFLSARDFPRTARLTQQLSHLPTEKPVVRIFWEQLIQPGLLKRSHIDLIHAMAFVAPLWAPCPAVVTVYDLSFLRYPEKFRPWNRLYLSVFTQLSAQKGSHFIAISHNTARDLHVLLNIPMERISVVYCGVEPEYRPLSPEAIEAFRREKNLHDRFILYVGTIEPRKNLTKLLEAYHRLLKQGGKHLPPLVIAGAKGWLWEDVFARVEALGLDDRVMFPGFIPGPELPYWYNAASLFVYPSTFEGFGLPVLEAMACGTPVITSNTSSLPEVVGDAGLTVTPSDVESLAEAMWQVLERNDLRQSLREQGLRRAALFSWDKAAQETVAVYERVLSAEACQC